MSGFQVNVTNVNFSAGIIPPALPSQMHQINMPACNPAPQITLPERMYGPDIFGSNYKGFSTCLQHSALFTDLRGTLSQISVARDEYNPRDPYSAITGKFFAELQYCFPASNIYTTYQNLQIPASPDTLSFVCNALSKVPQPARNLEADRRAAVENLADNLGAVMVSTALIPYPSSVEQDLVRILRVSNCLESAVSGLGPLLPTLSRRVIQQAVEADFNPLKILSISTAPSRRDRTMDESILRYIQLSKKVLGTIAYRFAHQPSFGGKVPLFVFLLRDAKILSDLLPKEKLKGETLELDINRYTLATQAELTETFCSHTFNIGKIQGEVDIILYKYLISRLCRYLGISSKSIQSASSQDITRICSSLLETGENSDLDFEKPHQSLQALEGFNVPPQINQILEDSNIMDAAREGRPVLFVDTGYRGSLPLLLQFSLMTILGFRPNVHTWVDYTVHPFNQLVNSHRSGEFRASPLDGLAKHLKRVIVPGQTGYTTLMFATPFSANQYSQILRDCDQFEAAAR